jgi:hypothetical protein
MIEAQPHDIQFHLRRPVLRTNSCPDNSFNTFNCIARISLSNSHTSYQLNLSICYTPVVVCLRCVSPVSQFFCCAITEWLNFDPQVEFHFQELGKELVLTSQPELGAR